jgi:Nucleotidyl transferase AbiEii toxin, Type IV TA system
MTTELEVLGLVSDRLAAHGLPFMLTGSFALAYYATPRMTRDLDFVVALNENDVEELVAAFESDFYIDVDTARTAVVSERMFNLMHLESGVKVDLIVRKSSEFRQVEFARRQSVAIAGIRTWIVSCEDLILSKLVWALESNSEMQRRDIYQLLAGPIDLDYIHTWAAQLGVTKLLNELMP